MPSDAMRVWREAIIAYGGRSIDDGENEPRAAAVIERAIAEAVEQERARIVAIARQYSDNPVGPATGWSEQQAEWFETGAVDNMLAFIANIERGDHKERAN